VITGVLPLPLPFSSAEGAENAGHEIDGHENARHELTGHAKAKQKTSSEAANV